MIGSVLPWQTASSRGQPRSCPDAVATSSSSNGKPRTSPNQALFVVLEPTPRRAQFDRADCDAVLLVVDEGVLRGRLPSAAVGIAARFDAQKRAEIVASIDGHAKLQLVANSNPRAPIGIDVRCAPVVPRVRGPGFAADGGPARRRAVAPEAVAPEIAN